MRQLLDIFLHLDKHLEALATEHGPWVYAVLFLIIFCETGLVVTPFLPGDSLLFAVGALAARGMFDVWLVSLTLIVAGVLGDAVNYHIGRYLGPRVFRIETGEAPPRTLLERLLNRKHLARAHAFFEKYGGKAVILARFVPIVRTFVPFVAGAGAMTYSRFFVYNVVGAIAWVGVCVGAGWFFGNIPWVRRNFELVIIGIIAVSLIPVVVEIVLARRVSAKSGAGEANRVSGAAGRAGQD